MSGSKLVLARYLGWLELFGMSHLKLRLTQGNLESYL